MQSAAKGAGSKAAAALAANDAYECALDQVLALGWAHADRASFDAFVQELRTAPASAAAALQVRETPHILYCAVVRTLWHPTGESAESCVVQDHVYAIASVHWVIGSPMTANVK